MEERKQITFNSRFGYEYQMNYEKALSFASLLYRKITTTTNEQRLLEMVNKRFDYKFSLEEIKSEISKEKQ